MKISYILFLAFALNFCTSPEMGAQEFSDKINKELSFDTNKKVFILYNLFGSIDVKGVTGNRLKYTATRNLKGDTKSDLEKAKKELQIVSEKRGDTILIYIKSPYLDTRPGTKYNNNNRFPQDYSFSIDFSVQVPKDSELWLYTVNDGDIHVKDVKGKLKVNNVNGSISLQSVSGQSKAHTVNGEVTADFLSSPSGNCSFKTINGDVKINCDASLSAIIDYKSMNGEFYTNYDIEYLPNKVQKTKKKKNNKTLYHLSHKPQIKIGNGKYKLSLETLNGDMTIKQK